MMYWSSWDSVSYFTEVLVLWFYVFRKRLVSFIDSWIRDKEVLNVLAFCFDAMAHIIHGQTDAFYKGECYVFEIMAKILFTHVSHNTLFYTKLASLFFSSRGMICVHFVLSHTLLQAGFTGFVCLVWFSLQWCLKNKTPPLILRHH